jgi:hypothetical protein
VCRWRRQRFFSLVSVLVPALRGGTQKGTLCIPDSTHSVAVSLPRERGASDDAVYIARSKKYRISRQPSSKASGAAAAAISSYEEAESAVTPVPAIVKGTAP